MNFEQIANQMHNERIENLNHNYKMRELLGETIYTNFCVWCNGYGEEKDKKNVKKFAKYLKQEKITLTEKQRLHLYKEKFGYKVNYNYDTKLWEITK